MALTRASRPLLSYQAVDAEPLKSDKDSVPPAGHDATGTLMVPDTVPEACDDSVVDVVKPMHEAVNVTPPVALPANGTKFAAVKLTVQVPDTLFRDTALNDGVAQVCAIEAFTVVSLFIVTRHVPPPTSF